MHHFRKWMAVLTRQAGAAGRRAHARPGGAAGWRAQLRALARERLLRVFVRDAMLLLALILTAISLDSPFANWALWWPAPLALAAAGATLALEGGGLPRWRQLAGLALFFIPLLARALFSLCGPLPALGLHEARDLCALFFCALALWLVGSVHPIRALGLWLLAMALGAVMQWIQSDTPFGLAPGLTVTLFSALWSLAALGWIIGWAQTLRRCILPRGISLALRPLRRAAGRVQFGIADVLNVTLFGAGLATGLWGFTHQTGPALRRALALDAGLDAQLSLWLKSLLIGWGHEPLGRLIEVFAEPRPAAQLAWSGPVGLLAQGGMLGVMTLGLWLAVAWRVSRALITEQIAVPSAERSWGITVLFAAPGALFMAGLLAGGGPRSALVLFALAGWLALTLVHPAPRRRAHTPVPWRWAPAAVVGVTALALIIPLGLTAIGDGLARHPGSGDPTARLRRAQAFNPLAPAIVQARAAAARAALSPETFSPSAYLRITDLYQEAMALDPLDPVIPMRLAEFELKAQRPQEALATLRQALVRRPYSPDLMNMAYYVAVRQRDTALAGEVLDRGLGIDPDDGLWWERQYQLAVELGQGALARQSLASALTATPTDPPLIRAAWSLAQAAANAPAAPPLRLPDTLAAQ